MGLDIGLRVVMRLRVKRGPCGGSMSFVGPQGILTGEYVVCTASKHVCEGSARLDFGSRPQWGPEIYAPIT